MGNKLYVAATEPRSGKSAIILGLMELLTRNIKKVAFFRPLIDVDHTVGARDNTIALIKNQYNLPLEYEEMYGYTVTEANYLLSMGRNVEFLDGIMSKYNQLVNKSDFVLCGGVELEGATASFDFDINADMITNLGCSVVLVAGGKMKSPEDVVRSVKVYHESLEIRKCNILFGSC